MKVCSFWYECIQILNFTKGVGETEMFQNFEYCFCYKWHNTVNIQNMIFIVKGSPTFNV